jgi:hypothetical protein
MRIEYRIRNSGARIGSAMAAADARQPKRSRSVWRSPVRASKKSALVGSDESSPTLQCWVQFFKSDTSRTGRSMVASARVAAYETMNWAFLSSLTGRICLLQHFPVRRLPDWATFIGSLRDECSKETHKKLKLRPGPLGYEVVFLERHSPPQNPVHTVCDQTPITASR